MHSVASLALEFFRFLDEQRIAYCVMGDSRGFPDAVPSDIDIVVDPDALPRLAGKILTFCADHQVRLVQCLQHESNARYFVLSWAGEDGMPRYLVPDICGDYLRRGTLFLTARELLAGRLAAVDRQGRPRGFFVAAPAQEFIYYLLKRIDKQSLDDSHGSHLSEQWRLDPDGCYRQLARFWDTEAEAGVLARAAEADDWSAVRRAMPWLRTAMRRHLRWSPGAWAGEMLRRVRRALHPTGLMVAFLGPDGSGKSCVIRDVVPVLEPAFRRIRVMHLRPRLGERPAQALAPVTDPQGQRPRGAVSSAAKLAYFLFDYGLGYLLKVRPLLARSTLVMFDRYYQDLLVDPARYRYGAAPALARWVGRLLPRPDLWLVLDAPVDVIQARKREVPPEESGRQREAYRRVLAREADVVVLDASTPLEQVVAHAATAVLECLARRTVARVKSDAPAADNPAAARFLLFFCRHRIPLLSRLVGIVFNSDIYARLAPSVCLPHPYGIVIHSRALIGERVTIMQQVTIGGKDLGENVAPVIGDDVYIGAGARVLGAIRIGNGAMIGANAVVTRDVPPNTTVVGANRLVRRQLVVSRAPVAEEEPPPVAQLLPSGAVTLPEAPTRPLALKRGGNGVGSGP